MNILISGATGHLGSKFINKVGKYFENIEFTIIFNNKSNPLKLEDPKIVKKIYLPLSSDISKIKKKLNIKKYEFDLFIHFAWPDLDNYNSENHKKVGFKGSKRLIGFLLKSGIKRILVTGTCFEYGLNLTGKINASMIGNPVPNKYAISKNDLRRWLFLQKKKYNFKLNWVVIFYLIDKDTNYNDNILAKYLISSKLKKSFEIKNPYFAHDFITVDKIINGLLSIIKDKKIDGIINLGSGRVKKIHQILKYYKNMYKVNNNIIFDKKNINKNNYFWSDNK